MARGSHRGRHSIATGARRTGAAACCTAARFRFLLLPSSRFRLCLRAYVMLSHWRLHIVCAQMCNCDMARRVLFFRHSDSEVTLCAPVARAHGLACKRQWLSQGALDRAAHRHAHEAERAGELLVVDRNQVNAEWVKHRTHTQDGRARERRGAHCMPIVNTIEQPTHLGWSLEKTGFIAN
jgi:hypothetical protein